MASSLYSLKGVGNPDKVIEWVYGTHLKPYLSLIEDMRGLLYSRKSIKRRQCKTWWWIKSGKVWGANAAWAITYHSSWGQATLFFIHFFSMDKMCGKKGDMSSASSSELLLKLHSLPILLCETFTFHSLSRFASSTLKLT